MTGEPRILLQNKEMELCPGYIDYHLKSEVPIASYVQPVTQQYESMKRTSTVKVVAIKVTDNFCYE